jgi:hypothetical protein
MDRLGALGRSAAMRATELADDVAVGEEVDALADQRGTSAIAATGPAGSQADHAVTQQLAFEIGLAERSSAGPASGGHVAAYGTRDAEKRSQHGRCVRRRPPASCPAPLVEGSLTLLFQCAKWTTVDCGRRGPKGR